MNEFAHRGVPWGNYSILYISYILSCFKSLPKFEIYNGIRVKRLLLYTYKGMSHEPVLNTLQC